MNSEELKQEAHNKENDMAFLGAMKKAIRQERAEKFEPWLEELKTSKKIISIISNEEQGKHTINTEKFGIVDYFPKANKLLIRKENSWKTQGLRWIKARLL